MTPVERAAARKRENQRAMEARLKKMAEDQAEHERQALKRQNASFAVL